MKLLCGNLVLSSASFALSLAVNMEVGVKVVFGVGENTYVSTSLTLCVWHSYLEMASWRRWTLPLSFPELKVMKIIMISSLFLSLPYLSHFLSGWAPIIYITSFSYFFEEWIRSESLTTPRMWPLTSRSPSVHSSLKVKIPPNFGWPAGKKNNLPLIVNTWTALSFRDTCESFDIFRISFVDEHSKGGKVSWDDRSFLPFHKCQFSDMSENKIHSYA